MTSMPPEQPAAPEQPTSPPAAPPPASPPPAAPPAAAAAPTYGGFWIRFLSSTCPGDEPFHNEYLLPEVRLLLAPFDVERVWYSALRFNILVVARRPGSDAASA